MNRRYLLAAVLVAPIAACSDAQIAQFDKTIDALKAKALARLKLRSSQFVKLVEDVSAKVPAGLADGLLEDVRKNDAEIQKATELRAGLSVYARALANVGDKLLSLGEKVPGIGPYANALRAAVRVLHMIADRPESAADDDLNEK